MLVKQKLGERERRKTALGENINPDAKREDSKRMFSKDKRRISASDYSEANEKRTFSLNTKIFSFKGLQTAKFSIKKRLE